MHTVTKSTVLCLSLLLLVSCSGGGGGGGGTSSTTTSTLITPAGGTVTSEDGKLTLEIPAGALSSENTITVKKLALSDIPSEFEGLEGDAYEFGPDGLTFDVPVTLTFESSEDVVAANGGVGGSLTFLISNGEAELFVLDELENEIDGVAGTVIVSGEMSHFSTVKVSSEFAGQIIDLKLSGPDTVVVGQEFTVEIESTLRGGFISFLENTTGLRVHGISGVSAVDGDGNPLVEGGFIELSLGEGSQEATMKCGSTVSDGNVILNASVDLKPFDNTPTELISFAKNGARMYIQLPVKCIGGSTWSGSDQIETIPPGSMGNGDSSNPDISDDGALIGMTSDASNFVTDDTNGQRDVFIYDSKTGKTTKVTVAAGSTSPPSSGFNGSQEVRVSSDGRYYVYSSTDAATAGKPTQGTAAKVGADTNNVMDIILYDSQTDDATRISVPNLAEQGTLGSEADKASLEPALSSDARYIVFWSNARNLVSGDTNGYADIFLHDRQTGTTTRVSVPNLADQGNLGVQAAGVSFNPGNSFSPSVSDDGRYVAFGSSATNLVLNDSSGDSTNAFLKGADVFLHDTETGETIRVSVPNIADQGTLGPEANNNSRSPKLSADGKFIVFESDATNLVLGDTNNSCDLNFDLTFDENCTDIFLYEIGTGVLTRLSVDSNGVEGNGACIDPSISNDGLYVAFECNATNLVAGDTNGKYDIFVHKTSTNATTRVSVASGGTQGDGDSGSASISGNGQYVAFDSDATNLVAADNNGVKDVFRTPNSLYVAP